MKIRIKGNSIRLRLTKPEVESLSTEGYVEEQTHFGNTKFTYRLESSLTVDTLTAAFENNILFMFVPFEFAKKWPGNAIISLDHFHDVSANEPLYLLLEKDFKCISGSTEDQSQQYDNPEKSC